MSCGHELDLADCTEFRQALLARPPRLLRGSLLLLVSLMAAAVAWAAATEVDLVVRAAGRVRPMIQSGVRPDAAAEESELSPLRGGRIAEIHVREGDQVVAGALLVRLDAERLDHAIAQQRQLISAAEQELQQIDRTAALLTQRYQTARARAEAELASTEEAVRADVERQQSAVRQAEVEWQLADEERQRARQLADGRIIPSADLRLAEARAESARLKLEHARLPVERGRLLVVQRSLELVEKDYEVERQELEARREQKLHDAAAARLELAQWEWEQRQSELRAPGDGTVTSLAVRVGDVVEAGQPVLAVAEQRGFRLDVSVASEDVGHLREGLPVRVRLDAFDYQQYGCATGRVIFVAPDSTRQTDATTQPAPAYTVRIALDADHVGRGDRVGPIKLGMTGVAEIVTTRERLLALFFQTIRQRISLG